MPEPAIYFEPDGYQLGGQVLLGRQVASHGFLRAAVAAAGAAPVIGFGPAPCAAAFQAAVAAIDPAATSEFIPHEQLERLAGRICHRPDPQLGAPARLRLRVGAGAYALCGVVHTTATVLDQLASLTSEPLAPWDALICPSRSVVESLETLFGMQAEYLRWRFGPQAAIPKLGLPQIPLGVTCDDFVFASAERAEARATLGLAEDEVAALFVGRFSFVTKGHPLPMYLGLQAAAERTGRKLALIQCGWAAQPAAAKALADGAAQFCPAVRTLFLDGRDAATARRCWAAADLFVSFSDNPQETFGLTPIEAMAAGLPVVVSDWDGYRESVRDGTDGVRVPTWAPQGGFGDAFARVREAAALPIDLTLWAAAASTAVDVPAAAEALTTLVADPDLRRRMGEAGRAHARATYDWPAVYAQHQALWAELDARRQAATAEELAWLTAAPRAAAGGADFFEVFGHYPSARIGPDTQAVLAEGVTLEAYRAVAGHSLFPMDPAPERVVGPLWPLLAAGPISLAQAAERAGLPLRPVVLAAGALAKMGLVRLSPS
jgi:glycosyltransferase involved in cell wall biosynthesis